MSEVWVFLGTGASVLRSLNKYARRNYRFEETPTVLRAPRRYDVHLR